MTAKRKVMSEKQDEKNPAAPTMVRIQNKLGTFEFDRARSIHFPVGVVGFSDVHEFGLADIPFESMAQFKLLQCLDESTLSFIVLPADLSASPIEAEDLKEACTTLGIDLKDLVMLFIITVRSAGPGQGISLSINHRAPIMIDSNTRVARQYVMSSNKYSVQHLIA
jgi:flagellar assembly factor FliW